MEKNMKKSNKENQLESNIPTYIIRIQKESQLIL